MDDPWRTAILGRVSRSIHLTLRDLVEACRWRHPRDELRAGRIANIRGALLKKRALKRKSTGVRKKVERPMQAPPASPEAIPIRVTDAGAYVHHHASPDDVRAILRALPEGTLTGIGSIEFCLGKGDCAAAVREKGEEEDCRPDPFTGRLSIEQLPGLYYGPLLGQYERRIGRIRILAFVHEPLGAGRERMPGLELYMRLGQLATLVHEVAHHDDCMLRTWRASDVVTKSRFKKSEDFAMEKEREWVREIVVPYLERAYPDQVRAWSRWMEATVGIPLPLRTLADDLSYGGNPPTDAYEELLRNVASGRDALETRIQFADNLHYSDFFDLSLAVTRAALAQVPDNLDARALEADVLEHLGRLDEAQASVSGVLERDDSHSRAWHVQLLILKARRAWSELAEAGPRARRNATSEDAANLADNEGLAHVHLGNEGALASCLAALRAGNWWFYRMRAAWLELAMKLRLGRFEEVLSLADAAKPRFPPYWVQRFEACRALALLRLGRSRGEIRVLDRVRHVLRFEGFAEWADELARVRSGDRRTH